MANGPQANARDTGNDDVEVPWDEQTDAFISELDDTVLQKYGISFRKLLLTPRAYAGRKGISDTLGKVRAEIGTYFDGMMAGLDEEQEELEEDLQKVNEMYTKIDQLIASRATAAKLPYITPADIGFGDAELETVYVDDYDGSVEALVEKFVSMSNYAANMSSKYKDYNLGIWIFSGPRQYILSVKQPENIVMDIENSRQYIEGYFEDAVAAIPETSETK